jgi:hypothetical protein
MIVSIEEFLTAAYKREQLERLPLSDAEIADMVALVANSDLTARLKALQGIPKERCHISEVYRGLLTRALALA